MELPGKRKRGRPKRWFMEVVKEDMAEVDVTEEDTEDRNNWRRKIRCGDEEHTDHAIRQLIVADSKSLNASYLHNVINKHRFFLSVR